MENTVAAFDAACALGFRVLETDLRLTADGHIVLHHDPTMSCLFQDDRAISTLTRRELESLRHAQGEARRASVEICFFDTFMQRYPHCEWVLDIKPETAPGVIKALASCAKDPRYREALTKTARYVTWDAGHEAQLRAIMTDARFYARDRECWRAGLAVIVGLPQFGAISGLKIYSLPPRLGAVDLYTDRIVKSYQSRGARVVAFLPESEDEVRRALAVGCDEILTNGTILG